VWSPAHESEEFWKENGARIGQENAGKAVKRLVELLSSSEVLTLAVSAHDVGQYVKHGGDKAKQWVFWYLQCLVLNQQNGDWSRGQDARHGAHGPRECRCAVQRSDDRAAPDEPARMIYEMYGFWRRGAL
jgi:hypothetical protein